MSASILKWRIATSEAGLQGGAFFIRQIPPVSLAPYQPFSKVVPRSDGGDAAHGYEKLTLVWSVLSIPQYNSIKRLVESVRPGLIYVTFELNDGSVSGGYADASGHPQFMQQSSESPANRIGIASVPNVTLTINNITIINNPSNYS